MTQIEQNLTVDGVVLNLSGDKDTVATLLQRVAPGQYHFSKSKQEFISVKGMATPYLVNAINKDIREQIADILSALRGSNDEVLEELYSAISEAAGDMLYDSTNVLIEEFRQRLDAEELDEDHDEDEDEDDGSFNVLYVENALGETRVATPRNYYDWQTNWRG